MKRLAVLCLLACVSVAPAAAQATTISGAITGRITDVGVSTLTVQTGGPRIGVVNALIRAADALSASDYPYVWGGGHGLAGVAGVGARGPGYTGRRRGFDCSGSVAAVLSGARLWPAGSGVPGDYGLVQYLARAGLIARGPGRAPNTVNLYDHPGVHIFMSINGRYFGTSDGSGGNAAHASHIHASASRSDPSGRCRRSAPTGVTLQQHEPAGLRYAGVLSAHSSRPERATDAAAPRISNAVPAMMNSAVMSRGRVTVESSEPSRL